MLKQPKTKEQGFTIIEVLIVLAIAGLIMLIVFLAVPALQRNSRNTQRRSDASHLSGLINENVTNNNGTPPTAFGSGAGKVDLTSENFAIMAKPSTITAQGAGTTWTAPGSPATDTAYVYSNVLCNNNNPQTGGGSRSIVVVFYIEPGTILQCVGN